MGLKKSCTTQLKLFIFICRTSVDSGYGGGSHSQQQPQSQPLNEQRRRRGSKGKFLKFGLQVDMNNSISFFPSTDNDEYQRELRLVRFKLDEERALNSKLEEKIRLHNVKVKNIGVSKA